jgi:hypothetical protein
MMVGLSLSWQAASSKAVPLPASIPRNFRRDNGLGNINGICYLLEDIIIHPIHLTISGDEPEKRSKNMVIEKKVRLTFPKEQLDQPIIYQLIRNFNLFTNILQAHLTSESGWLKVLVQGDAASVQKGLDWMVEQGVQVKVLSERTVED